MKFSFLIQALVAIGLSIADGANDNSSTPAAIPNPVDDVVFATSMSVIDSSTDQAKELTITLRRNDSPIDVCNEIRDQFDINILTYRWLLRSFEHSFARLNEEEVATVDVQIGDKKFDPISVRYGDDLATLSRSYSQTQGFELDQADEIYKTLLKSVPQHNSIEWVNRRRSHSNQLVPASKEDQYMDSISASRQAFTAVNECQLSVAIATSGDLSRFAKFVNTFPETKLICEVIVFSESDYPMNARSEMMTAFPHFNFIFKSSAEVGIVQTMHMAAKTAKSRYLMFSSDLWESVGSTDAPLKDALTILKGDISDSYAQVVLSGAPDDGWSRMIESTVYVEKEFGSMYIAHANSSSNTPFPLLEPSVWDLVALRKAKVLHARDESMFALAVLDTGLLSVHLPATNFKRSEP